MPGLLDNMAKIRPQSLADFPSDQVPQGAELWLSFVSFHNMVLLGMIFIGLTFIGVILFWRKKALDISSRITRVWLALMVVAIPFPVIACEFGWTTAEVGRQPWIVYKELRTADAASSTVGSGEILSSIILFGIVYLLLGALWLYILKRKIAHGPAPAANAEQAEVG